MRFLLSTFLELHGGCPQPGTHGVGPQASLVFTQGLWGSWAPERRAEDGQGSLGA